LAWLKSGLPISPENAKTLIDSIKIELINEGRGQLTYLDGEDVSDAIRTTEVTKAVSPVSALPYVRETMVALQREMGYKGGVVMDGRDIGTAVFPNAELKVYLNATIEARAERRTKEMLAKGMEANFDEIKQQIADRDNFDSTREHSPLMKAADAIEIDTSLMTIEQQVETIYHLVQTKLHNL
jgi:cytidylate kinase